MDENRTEMLKAAASKLGAKYLAYGEFVGRPGMETHVQKIEAEIDELQMRVDRLKRRV